MRGRDNFENLSIDGRKIVKLILKKYDVNWIHLAQSRFYKIMIIS
jgi:hypothetical protein